ncbi:ABC transporter arginine-binding protein 1 [Aquicella siphonis]|uniref:ABC transporter arginine-binding protein 1 n=1 Tax=Aquicella siphonis TaxID=254247 RepID=A0A5E4PIW5_9COXI|nr:transporter substrate-binding domain-containing protein [Aquicella siphonis]VVC77009.1 ABC transporter arginine-binding protein 1 [Aquicella siphonis]
MNYTIKTELSIQSSVNDFCAVAAGRKISNCLRAAVKFGMQALTAVFLMAQLSVPVHAASAPVIRFATEATYPPFEYIDQTGQIKGFDIDIANALCAQIKADCTFSNQAFSSLIPSLKLGKFDALISALGVTPERQKQVAFTHSYYEPSGSFVAKTASHYLLTGLPGKTIGVQQGSTFEKYLQDKYGNKVTVKTYASIQDAFLDLDSGRVDIVLADTPIALAWLKQGNKSKTYAIIEKPIVDHTYFGTGYGIAVNLNATALLDKLNKALAEIKANGTYDQITKKYFGD